MCILYNRDILLKLMTFFILLYHERTRLNLVTGASLTDGKKRYLLSLRFGAAAQLIADASGKDGLLSYARRNLNNHLKVADHRESTAERHYNVSGIKDQIVNMGTGVAQTFATNVNLNDIFSKVKNPVDMEKVVRYSHRLVGLRQLQVWVKEGKVVNPFRQSWCEWAVGLFRNE